MGVPTPSRRLILWTLFALLLTSALIHHRYTGYARLLKGPVEFVLTPATHGLRPLVVQARQRIDAPPVDADQAALLWDQVQQQKTILLRQRVRVAELQAENNQLRFLRSQLEHELGPTRADKIIVPSVVAGPYQPASHSLKINMGRRRGVRDGLPVMDGPRLVGRIERTSAMNAWVRLITAPGTRLNAIITDAITPVSQLVVGQFVGCQLDAAGPDEFTALIDKKEPVREGQYLRLIDRDWPDAAQGLLLGRVEKIEDDPDEPLLRRRITVRTFKSLRYLDRVDLPVPIQADTPEGTP